MNIESYIQFDEALSGHLQPEQLIADPLQTLVYGTDASFYRLIPLQVIKAVAIYPNKT